MHGGIALEVITRKAGRLQEFEALGRNVKWGPKIYKNNISNITNIFFSYNYVTLVHIISNTILKYIKLEL